MNSNKIAKEIYETCMKNTHDSTHCISLISDILDNTTQHVSHPNQKMTPFKYMCFEYYQILQSKIKEKKTKVNINKILSFIWGKTNVKLSDDVKEMIQKYNIQVLTTQEKQMYIKHSRKHNKQFKVNHVKKPIKNPYIQMCNDKRPFLKQINNLKNKEHMKIFGYYWTGNKPSEQHLQDIIKTNKIQPLTEEQKQHYHTQ